MVGQSLLAYASYAFTAIKYRKVYMCTLSGCNLLRSAISSLKRVWCLCGQVCIRAYWIHLFATRINARAFTASGARITKSGLVASASRVVTFQSHREGAGGVIRLKVLRWHRRSSWTAEGFRTIFDPPFQQVPFIYFKPHREKSTQCHIVTRFPMDDVVPR